MYSIDFTVTRKKFSLSLHYSRAYSYLFLNGTEIYKFKAKDSEIVATPLCIGSISKDWSVDSMKKTGFNGYVHDFSVNYDAIAAVDIADIHNYLMKKMAVFRFGFRFRFVKKCFFTALAFFSTLTNVNSLSCISMNSQECKVRPQIVNVDSDEPVFFPFSIKTSKCSGSCNNSTDPYAKMCVPDVAKSLNAKVFNLMSRTNETRHIEWHEACKYRCGLDGSVCNNKQHWNNDKCRCECKESIDEGACDKGFIWNPSTCECECDESCDVGEYLDYENCKCRKKLIDKLVEEYTETVE